MKLDLLEKTIPPANRTASADAASLPQRSHASRNIAIGFIVALILVIGGISAWWIMRSQEPVLSNPPLNEAQVQNIVSGLDALEKASPMTEPERASRLVGNPRPAPSKK